MNAKPIAKSIFTSIAPTVLDTMFRNDRYFKSLYLQMSLIIRDLLGEAISNETI